MVREVRQTDQEEIIPGNVYAKYTTRNPAYAWVVSRYFARLDEIINHLEPSEVLEIGCGEGFMSEYAHVRMPRARLTGLDISHDVVSAAHRSYPEVGFVCANAYHLPVSSGKFDLVLALEALGHMKFAEDALDQIRQLPSLFPDERAPEPAWRIMNLARGAYLKEWGNTPGHVRHWSRRGIVRLFRSKFEVEQVSAPFPWTMVLCRIR